MEVWSSSILANIEKSEMSLYKVPKLLFLLGFGKSTMLDSFHVCGMMLVLSKLE